MHRSTASFVLVFALAAPAVTRSARAQSAPTPPPSSPASAAPAPSAAPSAPTAPLGAPPVTDAPAPTPPPAAVPAPQSPPPPPSYGPQPSPYALPPYAPGPGYAPPYADRPSAPAYVERGVYLAVALGAGGPFGGNTVAPLGEGFGIAGTLGYALHPNFGIDAFVHYNNTKASFSDSSTKPSTNDGHVTLWGFEARGMVGGEGLVKAWASLGIAFGSGKLEIDRSITGGTSNLENDVDFKTMPVLAFGAEAKVAEGFRIGPQIRWYVTGVDNACQNGTATSGSTTFSQSRCATAIDTQTAPDILFVGVTVGYHQH